MKNAKIFAWSITVALTGFLFGFDTVVISGADLELQRLWPRGDWFHGFVVMSSALWGTVIGAMFGGIPTERLGRKKTLIWIGIFYSVSAIGAAAVSDPFLFACFRFIGGLGVGTSTIAAPAYISEIAPAENRGKLVGTYQFNIVFGILVAFLSNYLISEAIQVEAWRYMMGVEAIPAIIYTLMVFKIPESPRWLITAKNDTLKASKILAEIYPEEEVPKVIRLIQENNQEATTGEGIFMEKYRFPLSLAFLIAFFNQFSGINAFLYYAPRIFEGAGLGAQTALLSSIGIGVVNLIFTLVGMSLIDKFGRRQLMYAGSIGYILSLGLVGYAFSSGIAGMAVPIFLFLFIASHAVGQGAVIWVFISEIFPNHLRSSGQSFGSSVHWILAAMIPALVPVLFTKIGEGPVFYFFAFMMVLQLLFVYKIMPETKGVVLENMQDSLGK